MVLDDSFMMIFPFTYKIHDGHTEVTVDLQDNTYYFYIRRSDNIKKMWSVEKHSALNNMQRRNNIRDVDCLEAEAEFLGIESDDRLKGNNTPQLHTR
ncbi:MAG: hypothetical protein EOP51_05235 [Sphingobacteriales bacterium]|nr:MAG: hypothetical protein EOP51_05235 [Sphingobacteriales bacterium]